MENILNHHQEPKNPKYIPDQLVDLNMKHLALLQHTVEQAERADQLRAAVQSFLQLTSYYKWKDNVESITAQVPGRPDCHLGTDQFKLLHQALLEYENGPSNTHS
jgi:hypothetical protein